MLPTTLSLLLLLFTTLTSAWRLRLNFADGAQLPIHGHVNSGCTRLKKTDAPVTAAYFEGSTFADTFVLYRDDRCKQEGFRAKKGFSNVPNKTYRSYKVY